MRRINIFAMTCCCVLGLTGCANQTLPPTEPTKPIVEYLTAQQNEVMHASNFTYELMMPDFTRAYPADS